MDDEVIGRQEMRLPPAATLAALAAGAFSARPIALASVPRRSSSKGRPNSQALDVSVRSPVDPVRRSAWSPKASRDRRANSWSSTRCPSRRAPRGVSSRRSPSRSMYPASSRRRPRPATRRRPPPPRRPAARAAHRRRRHRVGRVVHAGELLCHPVHAADPGELGECPVQAQGLLAPEAHPVTQPPRQQLIERRGQLRQVPTETVITQQGVHHRVQLGALLGRQRTHQGLHGGHPLGELFHDVVEDLAPGKNAPCWPIPYTQSDSAESELQLALVGMRGRLRLLAGMVRDNRPWRLVPHLSTATAAAAATAAYGLVTNSFWSLADSLPAWRLAIVNAVAVLSMAVWILIYKHLWDRPEDPEDREAVVLNNVCTLVTLTFGVAFMYAILYSLTLLAAATIVDSSFLQSSLGHPAGIADYATITWLASSIGIVAGAIGSSLETEDAVEKATYSYRERQRRRQMEDAASEADSGPNSR